MEGGGEGVGWGGVRHMRTGWNERGKGWEGEGKRDGREQGSRICQTKMAAKGQVWSYQFPGEEGHRLGYHMSGESGCQ